MTTPRSWVWFYTICVTPPVQARGSGSFRRAGPARGHPQELASAARHQVGVPLERLSELSSLRSTPLAMDPQCLLPPGQHQPDSSRNLAADQPAPGAMGGGPGTGTGTEDPSRCHGRGKPHPLSAGFPDVVRLGSSPHPLAAPLGPTSQDRLFGSPAPGQATLLRTSPTTGASVVCEPIGIC